MHVFLALTTQKEVDEVLNNACKSPFNRKLFILLLLSLVTRFFNPIHINVIGNFKGENTKNINGCLRVYDNMISNSHVYLGEGIKTTDRNRETVIKIEGSESIKKIEL